MAKKKPSEGAMKIFYLTITTIKSVKFANSLETGEKQWGCEFLSYDFSSRNKINRQAKQFTNLNRFMWK